MQITIDALAEQPFFKGLSKPHLELLIGDAMPAEFKAGELIFSEGGPANRFYSIRSGRIALESQTNSEQEPVPIEMLGAGSVLGWSWLFPPYYWHFNARAVSPVKAIFFYGTRLRERCENDHELGYELMKRTTAIVIERLQATRRLLAAQSKDLLLPI